MDVECLPEVRGHSDLGGQDTKPLYPKQQTAPFEGRWKDT